MNTQKTEKRVETLTQAATERPYTYASTQATNCAGCGKYKHTPLRVDAMGGYVCLTCIDKKLGTVLGEFGYPAPQSPLTDDEIDAAQGAAYTQLVANGFSGGMGGEMWDRASARSIERAHGIAFHTALHSTRHQFQVMSQIPHVNPLSRKFARAVLAAAQPLASGCGVD